MQNREPINQKPGPPAAFDAWNEIVRITEEIGSNEAKAIRTLLYLCIISNETPGVLARVRGKAKLVRRLAVPSRSALARVPAGQPLFAFLYNTPANTNNLLPIFRTMSKRNGSPPVLTGENVRKEELGIDSAPSVTFSGLIGKVGLRERLHCFSSARTEYLRIVERIGRKSATWQRRLRAAGASIADELAVGLIASKGLRRLYETWQPGFLISTSNMWPFDSLMFDEANQFGIPSFVVQHGVINHYWWPFSASQMLVWGSRFREELLALRTPSERVAVAGMPASDHLFARTSQSRKAGPARSFLILSHTHARGSNSAMYERFGQLIGSLVSQTPSIRWSVKLHPNEDESFYQPLLNRGLANFEILPKGATLEETVNKADVVCTLYSTAGLEAMIMGKPLLVFAMDSCVYDYAWWPKFGGGRYLDEIESALNFIRQAVSRPELLEELVSQQDTFLRLNFANPGTAAEACVDAVCAFLSPGPKGRIMIPELLKAGQLSFA